MLHSVVGMKVFGCTLCSSPLRHLRLSVLRSASVVPLSMFTLDLTRFASDRFHRISRHLRVGVFDGKTVVSRGQGLRCACAGHVNQVANSLSPKTGHSLTAKPQVTLARSVPIWATPPNLGL